MTAGRRAQVTGLAGLAGLLLVASPRAEETAAAVKLDPVEVVGTTVLPGIGTPLRQVPANVQTLKTGETGSRRALNLSDALDQAAGSVSLNDTAGNPFQHDLNFRGFTASPSLGTPQGLSVFVDGVRVNEVFGDTINWDLIPSAAISELTVIPGSNPVFGLNTLGGALNVVTKSGFDSPGSSIQSSGGSFGRLVSEFETGGHGGTLGYFVAGNLFRENGWGEHSPSRVQQLFGKTSFRGQRTDVDLSLTLADNRLEGNQTLPLSFMDNIRQAYSWPDYQTNQLTLVNLRATHRLAADQLLEASLHDRQTRTYVLNSNVSNEFDVTQPPGPGNQPTGNVVNQINQYRRGASVQWTSLARIAGHGNHLVVGASVDSGRTEFTQANQEAGSSRDTRSNAPIDLATSLHARAVATGVYLSNNFGLDDKTFLTVSGRYNRASVTLEDQLGTALNGDHHFDRLNPAIGITHSPSAAWTAYAAYNEGMRVPTPVELTCADPLAPCSLPNAFASDPALKPVVSKTLEAGARGRVAAGVGWSAALYRTDLHDDLQFISSGGGATSAGYFQNVGKTRRQGLELALDGKAGPVALAAHYGYVDASFRTPLVLNSPNNSTAQPLSCPTCLDIQVHVGDRLPGIPRHNFKVRADWTLAAGSSLGASLLAQASHYARGDENNRDANGAVPGFAVLNIDARHRFARGWELFAKVNNLFDRRYSSFGMLGQNVFTGPGNSFDSSGASWRSEQFRAVGAPRGAWIGLSYELAGAAP